MIHNMPGAWSWYLTCWSVIEGLHRCQPTNPSFGLTRPEQCPPAQAHPPLQIFSTKQGNTNENNIGLTTSILKIPSILLEVVLRHSLISWKSVLTNLKVMSHDWNIVAWKCTQHDRIMTSHKKEHQINLCELGTITWCAGKKYARMDLLMRKKDKRSFREGELAG